MCADFIEATEKQNRNKEQEITFLINDSASSSQCLQNVTENTDATDVNKSIYFMLKSSLILFYSYKILIYSI